MTTLMELPFHIVNELKEIQKRDGGRPHIVDVHSGRKEATTSGQYILICARNAAKAPRH